MADMLIEDTVNADRLCDKVWASSRMRVGRYLKAGGKELTWDTSTYLFSISTYLFNSPRKASQYARDPKQDG